MIGGMFGLPGRLLEKPCKPTFLRGNPILLFNARSGIKLVIDQLRPGAVWLPSYLCPSILSAIDLEFSSIKFYPVGKDLSVVSNDFLADLRPDDLFLCIDYFGFPYDGYLLEQVQQCGCKILRDCSQALFFDFHKDQVSDFHLFSPRKFLGVPDGGILQAKSKITFQSLNLTLNDEETFITMLQAVILRRDFDLFGDNREWFDYFQRGETLFKPNASPMSDLSQLLLRNGFDYEFIQVQRRKNYIVLAERLSQIALFPLLPDNVVPLGFPVVVPDRDAVRARLFEQEVYPPIHWDIHRIVPAKYEDSRELADHIMTLPCDQRYDENDMFYMADNLLRLLG